MVINCYHVLISGFLGMRIEKINDDYQALEIRGHKISD